MGKSMVVAGFGGVARGFLSVAKELCAGYQDIVLLDIVPQPEWAKYCPRAQFLEFDIRKTRELSMLLSTMPGVVFINLCSGVDNVAVRNVVSRSGGIYIDTAGSSTGGEFEGRDSILLPYTFSPVPVPVPQLVCCGINPGMVELLVRKTLHTEFPKATDFDFESFEYDSLETSKSDFQPVSWCVQSLVDEVVGAPSSYRTQGVYVEEPAAPAMQRTMMFDGVPVPARIVCHEEVWTLGLVPEANVGTAFFSYGFREPVMQALAGTDRDMAVSKLKVPEVHEIIGGRDRVVVKLRTEFGERAFEWNSSHKEISEEWGVNATQYQTASCLAVFLEWLISGHVPARAIPYCAADMPIRHWNIFENLMEKYGIHWVEVDPSLFALQLD